MLTDVLTDFPQNFPKYYCNYFDIKTNNKIYYNKYKLRAKYKNNTFVNIQLTEISPNSIIKKYVS